MPQKLVLHVTHAFAFDSVRDDATRPAWFEGHLRHGLLNNMYVVAIQLADSPSKGAPFVGQRIQINHFLDRPETLNFVVVDDNDQIVQLMVRGKQRGFLHRALVTFAVTDHAENSARPAISFSGNGHPGSNR